MDHPPTGDEDCVIRSDGASVGVAVEIRGRGVGALDCAPPVANLARFAVKIESINLDPNVHDQLLHCRVPMIRNTPSSTRQGLQEARARAGSKNTG